MTNIDERGVKSGHNLAYLAKIDIADSKTCLCYILAKFNQYLILAQSDRYIG